MTIRILPKAERDLELGADFYEAQSTGLGHYFNDCLSEDIKSLQIYAGTHKRVYGLHRCLSKKFPFAVFYEFDGNNVDIYAVLDLRQDPVAIDQRLQSP